MNPDQTAPKGTEESDSYCLHYRPSVQGHRLKIFMLKSCFINIFFITAH